MLRSSYAILTVSALIRPSAAKRIVGDPVAERQWLLFPDLVVQNAIDLRRLRRTGNTKFRTVLRLNGAKPEQN